MPSPEVRTYEGADLESVLAEVFHDLGDDATIVSADRRRKGGVGGFFSKEVVEVVATRATTGSGSSSSAMRQVPSGAPATLAAATTLLDLADAASAAERGRSTPPAPAVGAVPSARSASSFEDEGGRGGDDVFVALARSLGATSDPVAPAHPAGFDSLFARAQDIPADRVAPHPEAVPASRVVADLRDERPAPMPERVSNEIPEPPARVRPAFTELPRVSRAEVEAAAERAAQAHLPVPASTRAAARTASAARTTSSARTTSATARAGLRPRLASRPTAALGHAPVVVPTEAVPPPEIVIGAAAMVAAEPVAAVATLPVRTDVLIVLDEPVAIDEPMILDQPVVVDEPVVMPDPDQPVWMAEAAEALRPMVRVPKRRVARRVPRPAAMPEAAEQMAEEADEPMTLTEPMSMTEAITLIEAVAMAEAEPTTDDAGLPAFARAAAMRAAAARAAANAPVAAIPVAVRAAAMRAAAMRQLASRPAAHTPERISWTIDPSSSIAQLVGLGLPARTAAEAVATGDLAAALGSLPTTTTPDQGVIVIAGSEAAAIAVARRMARELLGDGEDILVAQSTCPRGVAAWRWISDIAEVAAQQPRWADRSRPVIIALPLPTEGEDATWAAAMAAALRPVALHLVVDASASASEMAARVASMSPVQALHVVGASHSPAPATVLGTGVPIATVDGGESSPERWAELLDRKVR